MIVLWTGWLAGMVHLFLGPDHLAALAPMAIQDRRAAIRTGLAWGIGHATGVLVLGLLALFLKNVLDVEWLSAWSEFFVGFLLVGVGLWAMRNARGVTVHTHGHDHRGDEKHDHFHLHLGSQAEHKAHSHAAAGIGLLHGVAGAGHVLGVIPALALPTTQAMLYLVGYLSGAVASMAGFGAFLGFLTQRCGPRTLQGLMFASASIAIVVGLAWLSAGFPNLA